jgi:non-heme chloroperoxidase
MAGGTAKESRPSTLKIYLGVPHGLLTTNADLISQDLLAFVHG